MIASLRRIVTDRRGVSAVEFAILAPLLLAVFGFCVEASRMYMTYQQYQEGIAAMSRYIVRYPEYEIRTRTNAPIVANMVMPSDWRAGLNLKVVSLTKKGGVMTEEFSHVLFGRDPGVAWSAEIKSADFVEGENIVFVASTYRVSMLYNFFATTGITLRQTYQVMPFFSRRFTWNDGKVADKYVY